FEQLQFNPAFFILAKRKVLYKVNKGILNEAEVQNHQHHFPAFGLLYIFGEMELHTPGRQINAEQIVRAQDQHCAEVACSEYAFLHVFKPGPSAFLPLVVGDNLSIYVEDEHTQDPDGNGTCDHVLPGGIVIDGNHHDGRSHIDQE